MEFTTLHTQNKIASLQEENSLQHGKIFLLFSRRLTAEVEQKKKKIPSSYFEEKSSTFRRSRRKTRLKHASQVKFCIHETATTAPMATTQNYCTAAEMALYNPWLSICMRELKRPRQRRLILSSTRPSGTDRSVVLTHLCSFKAWKIFSSRIPISLGGPGMQKCGLIPPSTTPFVRYFSVSTMRCTGKNFAPKLWKVSC